MSILRRWAWLLLAGLMVSPAYAGCQNSPQMQPKSNFPPMVGRLLLHWWTVNPKDGTREVGTGQIGMYNFSQQRYYSISTSAWAQAGITDTLNPSFSPDGHWILFMAQTNTLAWNIYMYRFGGTSLPVALTTSTGATRNEDPKFSADGKYIVFKQTVANYVHNIVIAPLAYNANGVPYLVNLQNVTSTASHVENSMPYLSADDSTVYFVQGDDRVVGGTDQQILYKSTNTSGDGQPWQAGGNYGAWYPIVRDDGYVYFALRTLAADNSVHDRINAKISSTDTPTELNLNDCLSDNNDPAAVNGTGYVFFASTETGHSELYLGDYYSGRRWNLNLFGLNADPTVAYGGASYR